MAGPVIREKKTKKVHRYRAKLGHLPYWQERKVTKNNQLGTFAKDKIRG